MIVYKILLVEKEIIHLLVVSESVKDNITKACFHQKYKNYANWNNFMVQGQPLKHARNVHQGLLSSKI